MTGPLFRFALFATVWTQAKAQPPIPPARDAGYPFSTPQYGQIPAVSIEVFGDFQCPDTKALWFEKVHPLLAVPKYADHVAFVYHAFPLPYHRSGFTSSQAVRVVTDHLLFSKEDGALPEVAAFKQVADAFFSNQSKFQTDVTMSMSDAQIFEDIFAPIAAAAGMRNKTAFLQGMADQNKNDRSRVAWKGGCLRGVYGTPTLSINGVVSEEAASWNLTRWRSWLDSQITESSEGICSDTRCSGAAKLCCEGSTALQKKSMCIGSVDCDSCCGWVTKPSQTMSNMV